MPWRGGGGVSVTSVGVKCHLRSPTAKRQVGDEAEGTWKTYEDKFIIFPHATKAVCSTVTPQVIKGECR
jgi:hypothetical protein